MIGSLRGEVIERDLDGSFLVDVGGVGYLVRVSPRVMSTITPSQPVFLYIHHHIREAEQQLYGFLTLDERAMFQALIKVHNVGPALAMAVLGTHPPSALVDIVSSRDVAGLTLVPGIGKKTAERLIIELQSIASVPVLDTGSGSATRVISDVSDALAGLGYGDAEIRDTLREIPATDDSAELLRQALAALGARRA